VAKESATTGEVLNSKASSRSLPAELVAPPPADAAPAPVPEPEPEPQPAGRPGANGEKSGAIVISCRDRAGALRHEEPDEEREVPDRRARTSSPGMTTIPAPVGRVERAAYAMNFVPSLEVRRKSRASMEPPAIGASGGRESLSTHIGCPPLIGWRSDQPLRPRARAASAAKRSSAAASISGRGLRMSRSTPAAA